MRRRQSHFSSYAGRVQKNSDGFAFILSENPTVPDAYVGRAEAAQLLPYDRVEYTVVRKGRRVEARILKILHRELTTLIGKIKKSKGECLLETITGEHFVLKDRSLPRDQWVIANLRTSNKHSEASLLEVLGPHLLPKHDPYVAMQKFALPYQFESTILGEANEHGSAFQAEISSPARVDHQTKPFVTIDGEDAKDFDDAILAERTATGFTLWIAIADVSFFVRKKTSLDNVALARGTSVYLPGRVIPMLPEFLSNDLCSLLPRMPRLAMVCEIHFDSHGKVIRSSYYTAVIKTSARLTYARVQKAMEGNFESIPEEAQKSLKDAFRLYHLLWKRRTARGVLDFDLPEQKVLLDREDSPTNLVEVRGSDSNRLIEEFMIAANQSVAAFTRSQNRPSVYRTHDAPDETSWSELKNLSRAFGVEVPMERESPKVFARFLELTKRTSGGPAIHNFVLRMQARAKYSVEPSGHFGLALKDYTHFTSPIRRYPDIIVHRATRRLASQAKTSEKDHEEIRLIELAASCSWLERRAMEAERFIVKRKQCWFLQPKVGHEFFGSITSVSERGLFVKLEPYAVEGFLPLQYLQGSFFYDAGKFCLRSRQGKTLSLGDRISVVLSRVSLEDNQIELSSFTL